MVYYFSEKLIWKKLHWLKAGQKLRKLFNRYVKIKIISLWGSMNRIITFEIIGENFSPMRINFKFNCQNEKGDPCTIKPLMGKEMSYGSATYIVPENVKNKFQHLADIFEPMLPELIKNGATDWHVYVSRIYYGQCNEEIDFNDLKNLLRLKCSLAYSAFSVDSEEKEFEGFDYEKYCK